MSSSDASFFRICNYFRTQPNVELFPNPARNQVNIKLKQINDNQKASKLNDIREVRILDKLGNVKKIVKYPVNTKEISIDVINLPIDIYYLDVSDSRNSIRLPLSIQK
jgi:hypothetical protein